LIAPDLTPLLADALGGVDQSYLLEARQMQALSFAVHIPIVCFGIAFPTLVLVVEWLHHRTGDPLYLKLAKRWSKAMLALFAVGVVTGTILSFEMGLLWPGFTAQFGDVFGLGFALEGISFFVEAIFIGIYVYGWDRLSPRLHFISGIPIALAGIAGSLMVLSVNAWMQHPSGFRLEDGRATDVDPWGALFGNSHLWPELVHMYLAAYLVVGFLIAGTYAWSWLRGHRSRYVTVALTVALTAASLAAPTQIVAGDWIARQVAEDQPTKLAAIEGLGRTESGADLHIGGWYDEKSGEVEYGVPIPRMLSLLAHHDPGAEVQGLNEVPPGDRPPVNLVRVTFQIMVAVGFFLAAVGAVHLYRLVRGRGLPLTPWFFRAVILAGPLALVALIAGWVTTEVGRQPWVVYGVMRTEDAVTGAAGIPVGYATLVVVYTGLIAATAWILRRLSLAPLEEARDGTG
jgi:cytochrome bd ubiquinol oxidase subunit I